MRAVQCGGISAGCVDGALDAREIESDWARGRSVISVNPSIPAPVRCPVHLGPRIARVYRGIPLNHHAVFHVHCSRSNTGDAIVGLTWRSHGTFDPGGAWSAGVTPLTGS